MPCTDNALLNHIRDAMELDLRPKQAWTDVARLTEEGLDAANLGPGDNALAHQAHEWISTRDLQQFYEGLKRSLQ